jgi:hypothetical protein
MSKIPVGKTISSAYGFTFGHVGTVIGLIWLPLLIYYVGRFFIVNYAQVVAASADPSSAGHAALILIGFWFLSVFFIAIIGVSITRQAMTPKQGNIIVHFAFGQTELNFFLALLAVFVVMLAVYIAVVIVSAVVGGVVGGVASAAAGAAASINNKLLVTGIITAVALLAAAALIYIGVRLMFLVAPVTVAEGKVDLIRAWQLARGNFWRMLAVVIVTIGPVVIVSQLAFVAIVGPAYIAALMSVFVGIFQAVAGGVAPPPQLLQHLPDISSKTPMLLGLGFLLAPFTYGLMFSAPAFAYRALVGGSTQFSPPDMGPLSPA